MDGALGQDPAINRKYLKRANKSVDRMIHIIEDLEIISNLEAKRVQLVLSEFDMVVLVKEVSELLEDKGQSPEDVKLQLNKDYDRPLWVEADRPKVQAGAGKPHLQLP
ncbi:MAG: hypothetical protein U5L96_19315 [Owenweeksia sp.]|nr:hypothetical protein [Owenweeksia sp.]